MTRSKLATLVAIALMTVGCATGQSGKPLTAPTNFPARADLEAIAQRPAPTVEAPDVADYDAWELPARSASPENASEEAAENPSEEPAEEAPWREALRAASAGRAAFAPDLDCVAEQVARFAVAHAGLPDDRLLAYMAARCGVADAGLATSSLRAAGDGPIDELLNVWRPSLDERVPRLFTTPTTAGAWLHRDAGRAVLAMVRAGKSADVRTSAVEDGRVRIEGTLRVEGTGVVGYVNRGAHGVAPCEVEAASLPRFAVVCELHPDDDQAMIEVLARVPNHVLMRFVARTIVHRDGPDAISLPSLPASSSDLVAGINAARKAAGHPPLTLEPAQSRLNASLAPHFFAAVLEEDLALAERITLGLLAG